MSLEFEFIQVAMGLRERLSAVPSVHEWQVLFEFCKWQSLLGIGFAAVEKLHKVGVECPSYIRLQWYGYALQIERMNEKLNMQCGEITKRYEHDGLQCCILKGQGNLLNYPEGLSIRRMPGDIDVWATPIKYLIHTENTEGHGCPQADDGGEQELINDDRLFTHNIFSAVFIKLRKFLITDGVHTENTDGYGGPQADGGIKIAVQTGKNKVEYHGHKAIRQYVRMQYRLQGVDASPKACYHHIEAPSMDSTEVEVHYRAAFLRSPLRNWRMQRWFELHADECMKNKTHLGFSMMTSSVNVVNQMCHLYTHVFEGGIGLRQLMDYYFALRVWHNDVMECKDLQTQGMWSEGLGTAVMSKEEVMAVLRSFGMKKFASAVMYVLHEVFSMPKRQLITDERLLITDGPWLLCEPNEKEGRKLLEEIMKGGNFGQYDERGKELKNGGMVKHGVWKLKRVMRLVRSYPEEALWKPVFRVYHLGWRMIHY